MGPRERLLSFWAMVMEPTKPMPMPVNAANVPIGLKSFDRWVAWSWTWNGKKFDKPPLEVRTGRKASSTNANTWVSFDEAFKAHQSGRYDGIGFTLGVAGSSGVHFNGLDIDKCIENGSIRPDAIYLASMVDSYTEISPSGKGIKVFSTGQLLGEGRKKDDSRGIEFYDSGRYFTVTGNIVPGFPTDVLDRSQQLSELRHLVFPEKIKAQSQLSEYDLALSTLSGLNSSRADGYDSWLRVGMALFTVSENLLGAWEQWSQHSSKYTPGICEKKWRSFKKGGIGLGSLIHWAKEDGWTYPDDPPKSRKQEANGKIDEEIESTPRFKPEELNGKHSEEASEVNDNDPSMGNGLTEDDNAGAWHLRIEMSNPRRYWLRSPIWEKSLDLKRTNGYILLTKAQLSSWISLRKEAIDQSGVYVMPDKSKKPVWDGRGGPRLFRRLMHAAERATSAPDFDRVLSAIEWIIDCARRGGAVPNDKRDQYIGVRNAMVMEDGSIIFKLRALASSAKKDAAGFLFEDLRDAANRYGENYAPEANGRRHRYYKITPAKVKEIENEIIRKGLHECV